MRTTRPVRARSAARSGTSLLLRDVDRAVLDILKARAERHGRSLQAELQLALRRAAHRNFDEALVISEAWQSRHAIASRTKGRRAARPARALIAQDRRR